MKNLVYILYIFCGLLISIPTPAQDCVSYSYDSAGNRTGRAWTTQRQVIRVGNDSLVPVIPPVYIDSLSPKPITHKVDIDKDNLPLVLSEDEKQWLNEEFFKQQRAEEMAWWEEFAQSGGGKRSIDTTRSVGAIPLQEGISPSGARTYSIPIPTAAGFKLVPNISLAYNSQSAEGWAGYGWDIQGLSCIRLINKNKYYHNEIKAAIVTASDPVFALDGIPLVQNEHVATSLDYPLETSKGHILASPEYNLNNKICRFRVLFPNGISAIYGRTEPYNYNMAYYHITEMRDLEGNKITFNYTVDSSAGHDRITAIRYGYDSQGNYSGQISFSYTSASSAPVRYYAWDAITFDKRLTAIESSSDGEVLSRYSLTYTQKDNAYLISRVDCTSGNYSLSPIELSYGSSPSSEYIKKDIVSGCIDLDPTIYSDEDDNVFKRGKFMRNEYRDGVMIYLKTPTPSSRLSLVPRLEGGSTLNTDILLGNGFQTADAVDVDGDGIDEIVRVNSWVQNNMSAIGINVYKCDNNGAPVLQYQQTVFVPGVTGFFPMAPYARAYRFGDFDGDGKAELLTVAYNRSQPGLNQGYVQTSFTTLIDIEAGELLCNQELFEFPHDRVSSLIVNDIDSDGRTELCYATDTGFNIYRLQSSGSFSLESTLSSPTASVLSSTTRLYHLTDLNGDGYLDIIQAPTVASSSSSWDAYYYRGGAFLHKTISITSNPSNCKMMFIDINRDGFADLVKISGTNIYSCRNINGASFAQEVQSPSSVTNQEGIVPVNSTSYNKASSFIKIDGTTVYNYSYNAISPVIRRINGTVDSYGRRCHNNYAYLPLSANVWKDTSVSVDTTQGYFFRTLPIYVLSSEYEYSTSLTSSLYKCNEYEYYNGVVHNLGLGFCGFSRIRTREKVNVAQSMVHDVADVYYSPDKMGVIKKVVRKKGTGTSAPAYYTQTNTWDNHSTTYGKLNPRLTQSTVNDAVTGVKTHTYYTYDSWDYPTVVRTERRIGNGPYQREKQIATYQHSNTPTKYVLGSITREEAWNDLDNITTRQWKNKTVTTLDTLFRPLTKKNYTGLSICAATTPYAELTDSTQLVSETRWTYDSHGNILTKKSAPYGATEFIGHTYTYDSDGRYLLTDTDALGRTTTYANYNKFGKPEKVTDYRNRITYFSYDPWGKQTHKVLPNGVIESSIYAWGGSGVYTVNNIESGKPETITHYDALGREVRSGNKRFDGQWQYVDKQYNRYGQVSKVSLPFRGASATYWNTYTYDNHDRPTKILEPSGRQISWAYSGTSVTTVKDSITSVSTKDASGNVVCVSDAGGSIAYTLRDDGQPSKITAPGSVETTFSYDSYGRRTFIVDPSAGTQTEAYIWNGDGSHQQTHTGPNGSITTFWDKYGRTTSVQRPGEFNTTYTYNSYGQLSSVSSTNSTGTEYTYDSYDRVSTVKETVPDGKWLKKTYTYSGWRTLSSIKYTTQDGDITTETYSYANGQNTGVNITGGTTVWSLVSENDLGQPTQITTGSTSRQYGFTEYGLPAYRKMAGGSLQNFTYQFNVNTGNLTSRTDVINNKTESFKYDALNRLDTLGTRVAQYANNGNILSLTSVGSMSYANTGKPYQVSSYTPVYSGLVPSRTQDISYNSLDRPSLLEEGSKTAAFTYNAVGDRVRMQITDGLTQELTRYYIGGQYECDVTSSGTKERLYLGGDAYSAPMVYQRVNNGSWTAYNIGRDYLGSVTHIATTSGTLVAEYSYDPWGRLRNPATQAIYTPGTEPALFLGRGYTGHEHLTWFGLINMNARLYDPLLGRFLSPDPYVQAPDFTQNFNRYSYALNNPLKYTDKKGQAFEGSIFTFLLQLPVAIFGGVIMPFFIGMYDPAAAGDWASEIWTDFGERVWNAIKIDAGQFAWNSDWDPGLNICSIFLRNTWERPQMDLGRVISHFRNNLDDVTVDYYKGATVIKGTEDSGAMTLGSYINGGPNLSEELLDDSMLEHEYGHTFQSRILGPFYLPVVGIPSFMGSGVYYMSNGSHQHRNEWYEVWSNQLSYTYHKDRGYPDVADKLSKSYPIEQNPDWYFTATCVYYGALLVVAAILLL